MNQSRNRFWIVVIALLLIGSFFCFHWYGNNGHPITLVVPVKFTGPIRVIEDGVAPPIPFVDNQYVIDVPTTGVLQVRSLKPFNFWHQFTAYYADGTQLIHTSFDDEYPDRIALRGGGISSRTDPRGRTLVSMEYFVGTARQYAVSKNPKLPDPDFIGPYYPENKH